MKAIHFTPLGNVAEIRSGVGFPVHLQGRTEGTYPFAKVGDISALARSGASNLHRAKNFVNAIDVELLKSKPFPTDTIVFAKIGEAIRQNFRAILKVPALVDNNVMGVTPDREILDARYLYHYLTSVDMYPLAQSTTVPSIRKTDLERLQVPLPPLAHQKRIVATLDQVEALRAKRRQAIALLDDLAQSIFLHMFGGNAVDRADIAPLSSVAHIASGITKGRKVPSGDLETLPYMAVANVQDRRLVLSNVKEISVSPEERSRYALEFDDLLLTEGGDPDKLGRGTLWREELPVCLHQNHIFRVRISQRDLVDPVYLNWIVSSDHGKRYFRRTAKQTTGIASINKTQLGAFPLPLPPLTEQLEFRRRVEQVTTEQKVHRAHLATLDELFASLQHRAFAGTL
ncbi:restriction endonuclease subunit S [Streptomyces sp. NPDC048202]|uniref:restriction endonuclease subunit S n=1 Tax=Streptomyces sp. NPDC048202 TaxID=3365514 RepID=UPI00371973FD